MEYILCAAIHYEDGKQYPHQPENISSGLIICGRRHDNCYMTLSALLGNNDGKLNVGRDKQGFITNLNRYVDRKEGYQIAKKAGQLLHNLHDQSNPILISEDLY
ncbi:hypothetical protein [Runella sp.]|uniref:hypothetical protein n=1 Tax=Runella sp. TaxID=1960881 RepID=UPI003D0DFF11